MAAVITYADVINGYSTSVVEDEVNMLIEIVNEADPCLDAAAVPESRQKILKIYAVRHMLFMQTNEGRGAVTSEHAPSGASRSYAAWRGVGVRASPYGDMLYNLDKSGCLVGLIEYSGGVFISSIGGSCE